MSRQGHSPASIVRFGALEVDLATGELRRRGARVPLQEQPFRLLVMLLEAPGTLITREQLRRRIWPEAVFVDFEHGLNKAVSKLRRALGDTAEAPRFVETLPRRGYRFIAPVSDAPPASEPPEAMTVFRGRPQLIPTAPANGIRNSRSGSRRTSNSRRQMPCGMSLGS